MSLTIQINGSSHSTSATTVAEMMAELLNDKPTGFVAVAQNGTVVPKARWAETHLAEGDELEVVRPVPGG